MRNHQREFNNALLILNLDQYKQYSKKDIDTAYKRQALLRHPDKGGTHEQFLELSKAYEIVLGELEQPSHMGSVKVSLSVAKALATLYITISDVGDKLKSFGISADNIPLAQSRSIFENIRLSLRKDILDKSPKYVLHVLHDMANNLSEEINNIHIGPTPVVAAMVAGAFVTIILGISALMIALSLPAGIVLGKLALSVLVAIPPVCGLLFGTCCFFGATNANKNRSDLQQEMRKIVTGINALANAVKKSAEDNKDIPPALANDFKF
jgi:DnaJ domain